MKGRVHIHDIIQYTYNIYSIIYKENTHELKVKHRKENSYWNSEETKDFMTTKTANTHNKDYYIHKYIGKYID